MLGFGLSTRYGQAVHLVLVPGLAVSACLTLVGESVASAAVTALGLGAAVFMSSLLLCRKIDAASEEKCQLDEQLIQSQKLAAMGELSSGIAHEINTPLAIISQESEWLRYLLKSLTTAPIDPDKAKEFAESLDQISLQVERCREITHGMLNFARKRDAVLQDTDINQLLEDMVLWVEKEVQRNNCAIHRAYDPELPLVATDSPLLRQVVLNLLNNAAQAVERDGEITVATTRTGSNAVSIEVRDNGCGIPKENLDKIFNPFFTTKAPGKGTGLGLSISLSIVARLGGALTASSQPGEFTSFVLSLPIRRSAT